MRHRYQVEIREFSSGLELLKENVTGVDILFLDIEMEKMDGLELARAIRDQGGEYQHHPIIIFITGYREYVYQVFDLQAFHYLVKPVKEEKLLEVFERAVTAAEHDKRQSESAFLNIRQGNQMRRFEVRHIVYAEGQNRKVILITQSGACSYYGRLQELEEQLSPLFFRIHKGYLVNLDYIDGYNRNEVTLKNGEVLPVSKYRYQNFVTVFLRYLSKESVL